MVRVDRTRWGRVYTVTLPHGFVSHIHFVGAGPSRSEACILGSVAALEMTLGIVEAPLLGWGGAARGPLILSRSGGRLCGKAPGSGRPHRAPFALLCETGPGFTLEPFLCVEINWES